MRFPVSEIFFNKKSNYARYDNHLIFSCFVFFYTKVLAKGTTQRVSDCPRNKKEWQKASSRLNCSDDFTSVRNRYHCLPTNSLTTLVEFCYNRTRYQVTIGKLYSHSIIYRRAILLFIEAKYLVNPFRGWTQECDIELG